MQNNDISIQLPETDTFPPHSPLHIHIPNHTCMQDRHLWTIPNRSGFKSYSLISRNRSDLPENVTLVIKYIHPRWMSTGFGEISVKTESLNFLSKIMHDGCNKHTMHIRAAHLSSPEAHFFFYRVLCQFPFSESSDIL
jgi:hypothetical protein